MISVYFSFTTEKTMIFLYLLDLAFIPLEDRKLLKNQIQKHWKKKYLLSDIN